MVNSIYDIMALLCKKIRGYELEIQKSLYDQYQSNLESCNMIVEDIFDFLNKRSGSLPTISSFSRSQLYEMSLWIQSTDGVELVFLLQYLDNYIEFENSFSEFLNGMLPQKGNCFYFTSLNSNDSNGYLIPSFKPEWSKKTANTHSSLSKDPLSAMLHYIWVEKSEWEVINIYNEDWNEKGGCVIACSPLINISPVEYEFKKGEVNHFYIKNYKEHVQSLVVENIKRAIDYSETEKASILFFPELLLSLENRKKITEYIRMKWQSIYPKLLFTPSGMFKCDSKWYNQIAVYDNNGKEVCTYNKQNAYEHKEKDISYFEPISPDKTIYIIHIKGVGRLAIIICSDILDDGIKKVIFEQYQVNVLLIALFSSGMDQIYRNTSRAQEYSTDVFLVNSCAQFNDKINWKAFIYMAYGHKNEGDGWIADQKCSENKTGNCNGCFSVVKIAKDYNESGKHCWFKMGE